MTNLPALNLKKLNKYADWQLLAFLILFLNVKLAVKIPAVVIIYLLQFKFRFGFRFNNSRLPLFYLIVIAIGTFNLLMYGGYPDIKYLLVFFSGIGFWVLCILAMHQVKLAVDRNLTETIHHTIFLFFLLNALASLTQLACIIWETKALNPYLYQGMYQKYFIGTGDYIKGISFDVSITNSVLNALAVIYFLYRKNYVLTLLCMAVLLFTGSNSLNIITAGILLLIFMFNSTRDQKSIIVVCMVLLGAFMVKVSPQNSDYMLHTSENIFHKNKSARDAAIAGNIPITQIPDSLLNPDERREKFARLYLDHRTITAPVKAAIVNSPIDTIKKLNIPTPNIHSKPYQEADDTTLIQQKFLQFIAQHRDNLPFSGRHVNPGTLPGKAIALKETVDFLIAHPKKILTGNGVGTFSSKIAFKATNLGLTGGYMNRFVYIGKDFMHNHLDIYLNYYSKKAGLHSVIHSPNAVYYQLLGEYGLLGLLAFIVFYLGYFLKHYKKLTYGIPIMLLLLAVLFLEYWFEQLSVMVIIELLLLVNIKEGETTNKISHA